MKGRTMGFLRQMMEVLASVARSKSMALKSKTRAIHTRLIIYSLLRDKKVLLAPISGKLHHGSRLQSSKTRPIADESDAEEASPLVHYSSVGKADDLPVIEEPPVYDLRSTTVPGGEYDSFEIEDEIPKESEERGGSVIEMVRKRRKGEGEEFRLEDEIDAAAEMFIRRFHQQMRKQRQDSIDSRFHHHDSIHHSPLN